MPLYSFECLTCGKNYDDLVNFDEQGIYPSVKCPVCNSLEKKKLITLSYFTFKDPVGTDRWNSDSHGHDYRYKSVLPKIQKEREEATRKSHMGSEPYEKIDDI